MMTIQSLAVKCYLLLTVLLLVIFFASSPGISSSGPTAAFVTPANTGSISATPNPIQVCDGSGLGVTTIIWSSSGATKVEVHVGSPTGALLGSGLSGKVTTTKSVSNGTVFYLQDVSGKIVVTLAQVTVAL